MTPAAAGLAVQLDLTPGVLVAREFVRAIDTDGDGALSPAEIDAHAAAVSAAVTTEVDGLPVAPAVTERRYPSVDLLGAGGGTVTLGWAAPLPTDARQLVFTDRYRPGPRSAVQMNVLMPAEPVKIGSIGHTEDGRVLTVALNSAATPGSDTAAVPGSASGAGSSMLDALRRPLSSPWALLALVAACTLLGALHALTPGHGKALLAAYLVGGRGTPRHAITLGVVITFSHTATVLAVGGAMLAAGAYVVPAVLVPVLTIAAGVLVLALGIRLVRRRWSPARSDELVPAGHGHGHGPADPVPPSGLREVAAMGVSAGMIPCPEARGVPVVRGGDPRRRHGRVRGDRPRRTGVINSPAGPGARPPVTSRRLRAGHRAVAGPCA